MLAERERPTSGRDREPRLYVSTMRLPFPDLLATKRGRLTAFFLLYVTEGIPLGFTATAIATQMRRQGLGPAAIGAFVGSLYLPWAFKWIAGPIVDTFTSDRFGRRRLWILLMQLAMMATLLVAMPVNFVDRARAVHRSSSWSTTRSARRRTWRSTRSPSTCCPKTSAAWPTASCSPGAYVGQAIGGSGVLFLTRRAAVRHDLLLRRRRDLSRHAVRRAAAEGAARDRRGRRRGRGRDGRRRQRACDVRPRRVARVHGLARERWSASSFAAADRRVCVEPRAAVEPRGRARASTTTRSRSSTSWSTVVFAVACIAGGWLSDRFGRRRMLALFIFLHGDPDALARMDHAAGALDHADRRECAESPAAVGRRSCSRSGRR